MASFTITPLTDHTGAEVIGLDFTQPIDADTRAALNRAFAEHHVLVDARPALRAGRFQGAPRRCSANCSRTTRRSTTFPAIPDVYYVSNDEIVNGRRIIPGETFHTDHSNHPRPPKATMLFAVELPSQRRRHAIRQHARRL